MVSNVLSLTRIFNIALALCLAGVLPSAGQTPRILSFESPVMEIDTVRYDAGPVKVRFVCTNICDKTVSILDVHSLCGCVKPTFSRSSIKPGEKSTVEVTLDPSTLFAEQNRHLTVIATNGDYRKFNTITIHGYVERDMTETQVRYPHELVPGLRSEVNVLGMRLNKKGEVSEKVFTIYNDTDKPMSLRWSSDCPDVKVEIPSELAPKTSAKVKVLLDTGKLPVGEFIKSLYLYAGGIKAEVKLKGAVE